ASRFVTTGTAASGVGTKTATCITAIETTTAIIVGIAVTGTACELGQPQFATKSRFLGERKPEAVAVDGLTQPSRHAPLERFGTLAIAFKLNNRASLLPGLD